MGVKELVELSREYGSDPDYVLAGGGNTSFKDERTLHVKASGFPLGTIDEGGFVALSRERLSVVSTRAYSRDPARREDEVKRDLLAARVDPASNLRPSVESSLHDLIQHPYVVHTHPHLVNAMLCGRAGAAAAKRLFGDDAVYVPYTDPGYTLFLQVKGELERRGGRPPALIFLENHGVFVGGDSPEAVRETYRRLMQALRAELRPIPDPGPTPPRRPRPRCCPPSACSCPGTRSRWARSSPARSPTTSPGARPPSPTCPRPSPPTRSSTARPAHCTWTRTARRRRSSPPSRRPWPASPPSTGTGPTSWRSGPWASPPSRRTPPRPRSRWRCSRTR